MAEGARGKGRPKRTETEEIDRAIREAALQVLLAHGEGATMHAVAQAAGISRKSLYARHPNKDALFFDAIRSLLISAEALRYDDAGTAEARLRNYVEAALAAIARPESQALQRLMRRDHGYLALKTEMMGASRKIFFNPLIALLGEAKASGELAVEDIELTARATLHLIFAESLRLDRGEPEALTPQRAVVSLGVHGFRALRCAKRRKDGAIPSTIRSRLFDSCRRLATFLQSITSPIGRSRRAPARGRLREGAMKTMKGPGLFLAQFASDEAPFNSLDAIGRWAASLGYKGVQIPSWDARLFDLARAAESDTYCDEVKGTLARHGLTLAAGHLLVANQHSGTFAALRIQDDGTLTQPHPPLPAPSVVCALAL